MRLAVTRYGEAQTDHSLPVIILHGLFGSSRNWHPIAQSLSKSSPVYALDLRNHGKSPHSSIMDYPAMAQDVVEFMAAEHIDQARFIAHSMGGKAAMWLALTQPERVQKLVVVDIAPVAYEHDFSGVLEALQSLPLEYISSRKEADQYLARYLAQRSLRQFLLQNLQLKSGHYQWRLNLDAITHSIADITGFPDTRNIQVYAKRVLFIGGGQSDYLSRENQQKSRQLFPLATFSIIKNAGHWLHSEQPEIFMALIKSYMN